MLHLVTYHSYYVYVTTYKIMMNFESWIDFIPLLKTWKKELNCITHMIYTYVVRGVRISDRGGKWNNNTLCNELGIWKQSAHNISIISLSPFYK